MTNDLSSLTVLFTEFYYWVTVVIMFLIHVGFCVYEVGATRRKHLQHTLMKNTMVVPLVSVTFFLFGWWIYFGFTNGPWINGGIASAPFASPASELMGMHMGGTPASAALTADVDRIGIESGVGRQSGSHAIGLRGFHRCRPASRSRGPLEAPLRWTAR